MKYIFKEAATTVVRRAEDELLYLHYVGLLDGWAKPTLAKLTFARQIASTTLSLWRNEEEYDPKKLKMIAV